MLGEFEYLLLTSAARLGEDAYGVAIRLDIENSKDGFEDHIRTLLQ
jgi:hypothetical protein